MVALVGIPCLCASRMTSSHCSASALPLMILSRVSLAKISAPPPGSESRPASFSSFSTWATDMRYRRWKKKISTAVKALMWMSGRTCLMPFIMSMKYDHGRSGCRPPTMCTSRTVAGSAATFAKMSGRPMV